MAVENLRAFMREQLERLPASDPDHPTISATQRYLEKLVTEPKTVPLYIRWGIPEDALQRMDEMHVNYLQVLSGSPSALTSKTLNALTHNSIVNVRQAFELAEEDLFRIRNFGDGCFAHFNYLIDKLVTEVTSISTTSQPQP